MKILAFDTSTMAAAVAIVDENKIYAEIFTDYKLKHSEKLLPMIDHLLKDARTELCDIDALAVGVGPGSFTGLRIACATAKGLALKNSLKIAPVCSLKAVAFLNRNFQGDVFVIFDAGTEDVYFSQFAFCYGACTFQSPPVVKPVREVLSLMETKERVLIAGDGVFRHRESIEKLKNAIIAPKESLLPRAGVLGLLALEENNFAPSMELEPKYIKAFDVKVGRAR